MHCWGGASFSGLLTTPQAETITVHQRCPLAEPCMLSFVCFLAVLPTADFTPLCLCVQVHAILQPTRSRRSGTLSSSCGAYHTCALVQTPSALWPECGLHSRRPPTSSSPGRVFSTSTLPSSQPLTVRGQGRCSRCGPPRSKLQPAAAAALDGPGRRFLRGLAATGCLSDAVNACTVLGTTNCSSACVIKALGVFPTA
jgi:hypothetical protein